MRKIQCADSGITLKAIITFILLLGIAQTATAEPLELTQDEQAFIESHPVIRVHNETNWPPFNYVQNGKPLGFSIDFMNLVAERVDLEIEYVTGPSWSEFLGMMKAGTLDVMLNIVKTPEREKYLLFTQPYADNPNAILSKKETPFKEIESLTGKTVAVPKGFFTEEILIRDYPGIRLLPVKNMLETMKAVSFGKADAALGELAVFNHLMNEHMMSGLAISGEALMGDPEYSLLNIATRQDLPLLASILRKSIASISLEDKKRLQQKWLSNVVKKRLVSPLTQEELEFIEAHPVIRVHNELNWPPFNYTQDGEPQGFSIDFMNLVAERTGFEVEYISGPSWNEFLQMMKKGTLDVMLNIVKTPERQKYLLFTQPYADNPNAILSKKDKPYDSIESLIGKTVAVPKGFFTEEILSKNYPEIRLLPLNNMLETMKAVTFGKADAALGELAVFSHLLNEHMMSDLAISGEALMGDPEYSLLNIATRKDLPLLAAILRKGMKSISPGEKKELQLKWLGVSEAEKDPNALTEDERVFLAQNPTIRFHVNRDRAPYEFSLDGAAAGIAVDYIKAVANRTGFDAEFVIDDRPLAEALKSVNSERRDYDTLLYAVETAERRDEFSFGDPYLANPIMIVTHKSSGYVGQMSDLSGKILAIEKGLVTNQWVSRDYPNISVMSADTTLDALKMLQNQEVDAYLGNLAIVNYMINHKGMSDLQVAAPSGYDDIKFSFVAPKEWPELTSILSKGLRKISAEEHTEIQQKWFSLQVLEKVDYKKLIYISLFFLTILLVVIYKNRSIRIINEQLETSHRLIEEKNRLLKELVITDNLTKIYNRHKLDEVLIYEANRANRSKSTFGVILIDIDYFKQTNDTYGHQMGDRVLREFADILLSHSRRSDVVGRWGGEEFMIICTETTLDGLITFSENLRNSISKYAFSTGENKTASLGVSLYLAEESVDQLINRADEALYQAKEKGRNRVDYL
ncbi:MAG: transporter substrate-binding domain-containing protein [Candidatus Thiodiazotropha endolucinida]|nr:transporter substrate-binding domain-containing protein [Candidatus Thiodiazotropha taylori]